MAVTNATNITDLTVKNSTNTAFKKNKWINSNDGKTQKHHP